MSNKAALIANRTITLVPGTPEYDLVWQLLSAHTENLGDMVETNPMALGFMTDEKEVATNNKLLAELATTEKLVDFMSGFYSGLANLE